MSTSAISLTNSRATFAGRMADFIELSKPRIAVLLLFVVGASALLANFGQIEPWRIAHAVLGTLLVAASSSAGNQWLERRSDCLMRRTANRPLPSGRLSEGEVLGFMVVTLVVGLAYLLYFSGVWPAFWAAITWLIYVAIYTPLKPVTVNNTAIGAIAGSLPIFIGWSATGQATDPFWETRGVAIFLMLYLWQFPHFMAIAWIYRQQYANAGLKMLPVVDPTGRRAGVQAVLSAAALIPISILPLWLMENRGATLAALFVITLLGIMYLHFSIAFLRDTGEATARRLLRASLIYLPLVMLLLVLVHWL